MSTSVSASPPPWAAGAGAGTAPSAGAATSALCPLPRGMPLPSGCCTGSRACAAICPAALAGSRCANPLPCAPGALPLRAGRPLPAPMLLSSSSVLRPTAPSPPAMGSAPLVAGWTPARRGTGW
eukprot:1172160-Alexandrium_andersonii.AAC.1